MGVGDNKAVKPDDATRKRPKKKRKKMKNRAALGVLFGCLTIVVVLAAVYVGIGYFFKSHFYPQTTINGFNMSIANADTAEEALRAEAEDYLLAVHDRDDRVNYLSISDIDYHYVSDGSIEQILTDQKPMLWPGYIMDTHSYTVEVQTAYDENMLVAWVEAMDCFKEENVVPPTDAYIDYTDEEGYVIVPETQGSEPLMEQVLLDVSAAVDARESVIWLDDDDYMHPAVTSDDSDLAERMAVVNQYRAMSITYIIDGYEQVLDADTILSWITFGDDLKTITIDEDLVAAYVQTMASKYNTYADVRSFKTTLGDTIQIGGGDYGWVISKTKEAEQIIEDIEAGASVEREPRWEQRAFVTGADDIGNTYIEIDYTNQHLYYYKDGQLVVETDVVTGRISNGNGSPDGVFKINYKQSPATLVGEDYASDVTFFMPFAYNVGLHDASWRSSFGGTIYVNSGSHGCVNMPYDAAETIYNQVEVGTPVIAYYRESVKLTSNSSRISNAYSYSGS